MDKHARHLGELGFFAGLLIATLGQAFAVKFVAGFDFYGSVLCIISLLSAAGLFFSYLVHLMRSKSLSA